jgi:AcrR family transcriptional regulator
MRRRDADETRRRIFEAATAEFGTHGIAGARIDRIAATARANKQLIYAYFGNKRELFDSVVTEHLSHLLEDVPFDPADLPAHAAGIFDHYSRQPALARLSQWHALDPADIGHRIPAIERLIRSRVAAVAKAQKAGAVTDAIPASELLAIVATIASMWAVGTPEWSPPGGTTPQARRRHRAAVVEAVRRLVSP